MGVVLRSPEDEDTVRDHASLEDLEDGDTQNSSPEETRPQESKPGSTFSHPLPHLPMEPTGSVS